MSKFCQNCGNMLEDSAAFCDRCGKPFEAPDVQPAAPQTEAPATSQYEAPQYEAPVTSQYEAPQYEAPVTSQYEAPQYEAPVTSQYEAPQYGDAGVAVKVSPIQAALQFVIAKKVFFLSGAAVLVLIIALIAIFSSCASNTPEGALNTAFDSMKELNIRGAADVSYELNFGVDTNKEEEIKKSEEQLQQYASMIDMIKSMMKSAKLTVKSSEAVTGDELNSLKESWASSYKDTDKISEIQKIEYEISGLMGTTNSGTTYAVKVGGKWYVKDFSGSSSGLGL